MTRVVLSERSRSPIMYSVFVERVNVECSLKYMQFKCDDGEWTACDAKFFQLQFGKTLHFAFSTACTRNDIVDDSVMEAGDTYSHGLSVCDARSLPPSSNNERSIPILSTSDYSVIGSIRLKFTRVPSPFTLRCKKVDLSTPIFIGHRGSGSNQLGSRVLENTLLSFNLAMKHAGPRRLAGVELDVLLTRDNKLVVYHDLEYPVEPQRKPTPVSSLEYARFCRTKFNRSTSLPSEAEGTEFVAEDCPLLGSVLRGLEPANAGIVIELKYPTNDAIRRTPALGAHTRCELVHAVLECVAQNRQYVENRWIVFSSFDPDIVVMLASCLQQGGSQNALVLHNTWFGHQDDEVEDDTVDFTDVRNRIPTAAIEQAQRFGTGLGLEASYVIGEGVDAMIRQGCPVPLFTYGYANTIAANITKQANVSGFFVDNIRSTRLSS